MRWSKHSSLICYKAAPTQHLQSVFPMHDFTRWSPSMPQKLPNFSGQREFLYLSRILLPFETRGCSCMCACATRILATASIRERRLFAQHVRRCGDNSRTATNRERRLIESGVWSSKYGTVFSTVLRRNWKTPTVFGWEFSYCKTKLFVLSVIDTFQLSWLALLTAW